MRVNPLHHNINNIFHTLLFTFLLELKRRICSCIVHHFISCNNLTEEGLSYMLSQEHPHLPMSMFTTLKALILRWLPFTFCILQINSAHMTNNLKTCTIKQLAWHSYIKLTHENFNLREELSCWLVKPRCFEKLWTKRFMKM